MWTKVTFIYSNEQKSMSQSKRKHRKGMGVWKACNNQNIPLKGVCVNMASFNRHIMGGNYLLGAPLIGGNTL